MKIKKNKENLVVNTDGKNVLFYLKGNVDFSDYSSVVNLSSEVLAGSNVMSSPGEYEIQDILFSIFAYGENLDHPDIIFLDSNENIRVMYILPHVENVDKSIIEKLPDVNVLITEIDGSKLSNKLQIVSDLEPDYFVPLVDKTRVEEINKEMGISNIEVVTTLNINSKDTESESAELKVYLLNN